MMDIDPVSVTSVARTLSSTVISSPTINTKTGKKRKAEDEMATHLSAHEKRPRTVAASDISLARNHVSGISLDGKSLAKALKQGGLKFHIPVKLS